MSELEALRRELKLLKGWVEANTRRIEELEGTSAEQDYVRLILLVTVPRVREDEKHGHPVQ